MDVQAPAEMKQCVETQPQPNYALIYSRVGQLGVWPDDGVSDVRAMRDASHGGQVPRVWLRPVPTPIRTRCRVGHSVCCKCTFLQDSCQVASLGTRPLDIGSCSQTNSQPPLLHLSKRTQM